MNGLILTMTEAAQVIGVSRWFIQALCRKGELRFIPLGRKHKRIARTEIDRWIRDSQVFNDDAFKKVVDRRRK